MRWLLTVALLAGCDGAILGRGGLGLPNLPGTTPPDPTNPVPTKPEADPREARCQNELGAAWGPLRRVTHEEYDNSVGALLRTTLRPSSAFPSQARSNGFTTGSAQQTVGELQAEAYFDAAELIAADVVKNVPALLQCDVASVGQAECGRRFVTRFVTAAFRRPLTTDEAASYQALMTTATTQLGFPGALETVVFAVLQSPHFLYHVELGPEVVPGVLKLDGASVAARLATALWQSMPDDTLVMAAARGELDEPAGISAQARRMVEDPKARPVLVRLYSEFTRANELDDVTKDAARFPNWSSLRTSMKEENERFLTSVLFDGEGSVESLFTARHTFVDATLAQHYGLPPVTGWQRVSLAGTKRLGLLTQGAVLSVSAKTNQSSPTQRGLFIRENVLCNPPPPPPQNANIVPPDIKPGVPTRQRFAEHSTNPECAGCHLLMDPIGLGFEHFDAVGGWRDRDEGVPVDATGEVFGTSAAGAFDGVEQLATKLSTSRDVNACMGKQTFRFLIARHEFDADTCSLYRLEKSFGDGPVSLKELVVGLTTSDAFRYRKVNP